MKEETKAIEETKILIKKDIMTSKDLNRELVEVPEWGGSVWVSELSSKDKDAWEVSCMSNFAQVKLGKESPQTRTDNVRARLIVFCIVDPEGKRIFNENDIERLGEKSGKAVDRVFTVAQRLNKMTQRDIEVVAGNLPETPEKDSSSD